MIALGTILHKGTVYSSFLIVYNGDDTFRGYNYIQNECNRIIRTYESTEYTFDFKALHKGNQMHSTDVPEFNYLVTI